MPSYKLQVQEDEHNAMLWQDVKGADGKLLVFDNEPAARAKLEALYPVWVKLEKFASGAKRTRVVIVSAYQDIDDEKENDWKKK